MRARECVFVCMGVCVCVCVREKERERERACLSKTHTKECLQNFEKFKQTKTRKKTATFCCVFLLTVFCLKLFLGKSDSEPKDLTTMKSSHSHAN